MGRTADVLSMQGTLRVKAERDRAGRSAEARVPPPSRDLAVQTEQLAEGRSPSSWWRNEDTAQASFVDLWGVPGYLKGVCEEIPPNQLEQQMN